MHQVLKRTFLTAVLVGALVGELQAGPTPLLKSVSGGLGVLDTSTGLEWLQDWNLAGRAMTWNESVLWVKVLNASNYAGHSDWRLATTNTTAASNCSNRFNPGGGYGDQYLGYGCTGSEMGHLFYSALGGKARQSVLDQVGDTDEEKANLALFKNVQSYDYWTSTEYAPDLNAAWLFGTAGGYQDVYDKRDSLYAIAVRSGDVAAAAPEPKTLALTLMALACVLLTGRRAGLRITRAERQALNLEA